MVIVLAYLGMPLHMTTDQTIERRFDQTIERHFLCRIWLKTIAAGVLDFLCCFCPYPELKDKYNLVSIRFLNLHFNQKTVTYSMTPHFGHWYNTAALNIKYEIGDGK